MSALDRIPKYTGPCSAFPNRGAYEAEVSKILRKMIIGNDSEKIIGLFSIDGLTPVQLEKFQSELGSEIFEYDHNVFLHSIGIHDTINLIFEDFRPIIFVRDMVIAKMLETSVKYLKLAIGNLNKDLVVVDIAKYSFSIQFEEVLVDVEVVCKPDLLYSIIQNIDKYFTQEIIDSLTDSQTSELGVAEVYIGYEEHEQKVKVAILTDGHERVLMSAQTPIQETDS